MKTAEFTEPSMMSNARPRCLLASVSLLLTAILMADTTEAAPQSDEDASAAAVGPIVTDRPTDSASPLVVPRHAFQLELGYKFSRLEQDSDTIDTRILPDLLARYGITHTVEIRLVTAGWTFEDRDTGSRDGQSDISLGAKFALGDEKGRRPQMGLLVDVSLPLGHDDFTSDYVIPKVLFLASHTLTDRLGLTYNVGPSVITSENNGEKRTDVDLNYAVALSGATGGPVSLFGELYGALSSGTDRLDRHNFQAGATLLVNRVFQLDIRGGLGLVDNEPDWLVGAGLAFRVPN